MKKKLKNRARKDPIRCKICGGWAWYRSLGAYDDRCDNCIEKGEQHEKEETQKSTTKER